MGEVYRARARLNPITPGLSATRKLSRNGARGDQLGEQSSVVWFYSDWTSGSLRRTSRIIFECAVSRCRKRDEARYRCTVPAVVPHPFFIFCIGRSGVLHDRAGLGQAEMTIASMNDRARRPD